MLLAVILLSFLLSVVEGLDINCTVTTVTTSDADVHVYKFLTKDDCEEEKNCVEEVVYDENECLYFQGDFIDIGECYDEKLDIDVNCEDNDCDDCQEDFTFGKCDEENHAYYLVDGGDDCIMDPYSTMFFSFGTAAILFGILCCPICFCCICVGIALCVLGCVYFT